ncbi:unnamed protein product [Hymenolepis diminuta]|uniref:Secreted protein n=1 Tax=Hymenolepis diminuta TaxID=6216 RepID=A0A0R3SW66_HYMDI|nr:unnamed protein product [Hymenolepis diminuta]
MSSIIQAIGIMGMLINFLFNPSGELGGGHKFDVTMKILGHLYNPGLWELYVMEANLIRRRRVFLHWLCRLSKVAEQ